MSGSTCFKGRDLRLIGIRLYFAIFMVEVLFMNSAIQRILVSVLGVLGIGLSGSVVASSVEDSIDSLIDEYSEFVQSVPNEMLFHSFELRMSPEEYARVLEDCFMKKRSDSAKDRVIKLLVDNQLADDVMLSSRRDDAVIMYCGHVLAAAPLKGISFHARPAQHGNREAQNIAELLNRCYSARKDGIQGLLREATSIGVRLGLRSRGASALDHELVAVSSLNACHAAIAVSDKVAVAISVR